MTRIARWDNLPANVRQHLTDRMRDRAISIVDLNQLRLWIEHPEVPEGYWFKAFRSFKICGRGSYPRRSCFAASALRARPFDPITFESPAGQPKTRTPLYRTRMGF